MNLDRVVMGFAGAMVILGALLTALVSTWWLLLVGFVGLNLLQSSITGWCPVAIVLAKLGVPPGHAFAVPGTPETSTAGR